MRHSFYVIAEPCVGVKDKSCVAACPVDCIQGGESDAQLFIDPEECIFCGACQSECPVGAIFADDELPEKWLHYAEKNAAYFSASAR
jgi:ferredoxin